MYSDEPHVKRARIDTEPSKLQLINDYITQLQQSQKNLNAILSDDLQNPIPMINIYAGQIKDSKMISKTIHVLNEKIPLQGLTHLKRARNNIILLCSTQSLEAHNMSIQDYIECIVPELNNVFEYFKELSVPAIPLKLRKQYLEVSRKWSCNFHPDSYLEKLASDNFFTPNELESHKKYMGIAFKVALHYFESSDIDVTEDMFRQINVTIVVDPEIQSVVAIALSRLNHPMQHSVMIAIDNVAKTQNGGAWDCKEVTDITLAGIDEELLLNLKDSAVFGAKKFVSKQEYIDKNEKFDSSECGPYLCTNYYVYSLREPCLMCAMALVHARARRVFFCFNNPEFGSLKSKTKLHTMSALNHRYEVFTGFL